MKNLAILLASFSLFGCAKDPVSTSSTSNQSISVHLLFEHDGVKVYRFSDGGSYIYYTDARGKTEWRITRSTGKSATTERFEVTTADTEK